MIADEWQLSSIISVRFQSMCQKVNNTKVTSLSRGADPTELTKRLNSSLLSVVLSRYLLQVQISEYWLMVIG